MNGLFTKSSDLALSIGDAHTHEEAIFKGCLLALLEFVFIWEELIDHAHILELACIFVVGLATNNQNVV